MHTVVATRQVRLARVRPSAVTAGPSRSSPSYHHQAPRSRGSTNGGLFQGRGPHIAQNPSDASATIHLPSGRDSPATISEPSTPRTSGEHEQEHKTPKFKFSPTMILENNGSVARDHLASERTFLAYVRTSLAISSAGVGERHSFISWIQTLISILSFGSTIPDIDGKFTGPSFCEASWSNCRHHRADCAPHR